MKAPQFFKNQFASLTKKFNCQSNRRRRPFLIILLFFSALLLFQPGALQNAVRAQCVSLTTIGAAATQNFDTLSNTAGSTTNNLTITGWFMTETGGGARDNEQYAVDTGGSTTGDTYSYGAAASTERALGGLRSGTLIPNFGACFTNNTGTTVTSLAVNFTGEEWRLGTAGRTDQINFEYSLNATDLVTGTWTGVPALNFVTPDTVTAGAKNGNAAADRTALGSTITGLSIATGATFWIRWTDIDATGADDGLSVDDFSLTPQAPTAAAVIVAGRVVGFEGRGLGNVVVTLTGGTLTVPRTARTNPFGNFKFEDIELGQVYVISVTNKKYSFVQDSFIIMPMEDLTDIVFQAAGGN